MIEDAAPLGVETIDQYHFELKKEVISNKNNKFLLFFNAETTEQLNIKAIKSDLVQKVYSNKFQVKEIRENKYFVQFDNLKELCEELTIRISKDEVKIIEDINSILLSIPLPSSKIKEIIFE